MPPFNLEKALVVVSSALDEEKNNGQPNVQSCDSGNRCAVGTFSVFQLEGLWSLWEQKADAWEVLGYQKEQWRVGNALQRS